ncbi:FGGY family carbohydrate kinase [Cellulomonas sp. 73-145]|uniref:FGGY-family carbohydrate kinase n=1 Tax=unclassified Cellulomonas TaxID=2620175 RepID=UPI0025BA076E|nr:FGGY family carbohydrate kinase [Cellulomonas sp. 73-145]
MSAGAGANEGASVRALGLDLGTTNTKAALVVVRDGAVRVVATAWAATPAPAALEPVLAALVREVLRDGAAPDAVGISSMAETGVPLDGDDRPLGDWLRWDGHRAEVQARRLAERLGAQELAAATGVRPSAKVPLATWAWLREHEPDRWSAMVRWAGVADLACLVLTGTLATDHTLAGRTQAYRLPEGSGPLPVGFDPELLAEVGLRPDRLPHVVAPGAVAGHVRSAALVAAGLRPGTPVVVAGHDHAVGAYGAGVRRPGQRVDSVGTSEAVITVLGGPLEPGLRRAASRAGMSVVVTPSGRDQALLAGSSSAGAALRWWSETTGLPLDELPGLVDAAGPGPTGVLVLPYVSGRQTPEPDPSARLEVLGERRPAARFAKAVLEGVCLHARWMTAEQERLAARAGGPAWRPGAITALGAPLVRNPAWARVAAEVAEVPLQLTDCPEPVAVGAALLAAERVGLGSAQLSAVAAPGRPDPRYDAVAARFVAAATGAPGVLAAATAATPAPVGAPQGALTRPRKDPA